MRGLLLQIVSCLPLHAVMYMNALTLWLMHLHLSRPEVFFKGCEGTVSMQSSRPKMQ